MTNFIFSVIRWDVSPEIFTIGTFQLRWYGLLFALGLVLGQLIITRIFKAEGKPVKDVDRLTLYMIIAVIVGARLGHCLFYEPDYYLSNPIEILKVWKGGLASHGAAIGILIALYLYARKTKGQSYLWILDRIVIVVALAGCCIRLGNLMNSEIIGKPSDLPWAFIFLKNTEFSQVARHPAQLYEAISSFLIFVALLLIWRKHKVNLPEGRLFGIFLVVLFSLRFFYEFLKENQVDFESSLPLNMGQILSIPAVLVGVVILLRSCRKGKHSGKSA